MCVCVCVCVLLTTGAVRRTSDFRDLLTSINVPQDSFMYTTVMLGGERGGGKRKRKSSNTREGIIIIPKGNV